MDLQGLVDAVAACWSCGAYSWLVQLAVQLGAAVTGQLVGPSLILLALGAGAAVIAHTLRIVNPFGAVDEMQGSWRALWARFGAVLIAATLLSLSDPFGFIANWVAAPVLSVGVTASQAVLSAAAGITLPGSSYTLPALTCSAPGGADAASILTAGGTCLIKAVNQAFGTGLVYGATYMVSMTGGFFTSWLAQGLKFLIGLGVVLVFGAGLLLFPLRLLEALLRLIVVAAATPLLIVAVAFGPTRRFATGGLKAVTFAAVQLFVMTVIGVVILALVTAVGSQATGQNWTTLGSTALTGAGALNIPLSAGFLLIGVGIVALFLLSFANKIATEIAGAGGDLGGTIASAAVGAAVTASALSRSVGRALPAAAASARPAPPSGLQRS